jgi:hypothetical protein
MRYGRDVSGGLPVVEVALLECRVQQTNGEALYNFDLLGVEFFDDESMVLLYRCPTGDGALISYV